MSDKKKDDDEIDDDEISQPQRNIHPNSLANLNKFEPGQSGNPGGFPKSERVDIAYMKLLKMSPEEIAAHQPKNGAEILAYEQFKRATSDSKLDNTLPYAQEVTNRTIGSVASRNITEVTVNIEDSRRIQVKAYRLVFLQKPLELALDEIRQIYATQDDEAQNCQVIAEVLEADEAAFEDVRQQAEALVLGEKR